MRFLRGLLCVAALVAGWCGAMRAEAGDAAERQYFLYERSVAAPGSTGQACAVLDANVFAHAAASLKDLRLYRGASEVPYAITLSEPQQQDTERARVLNLGRRGGSVVFDLEMPARAYTEVMLDLAARNFVGRASVSGMDELGAADGTALGSYTVFDLTAQRLARNTTLPLQESRFRYLHVVLDLAAAPGAPRLNPEPQMVRGAAVPPSREAQTLYAPAAISTAISQQASKSGGRQTVATIELPERVPVERVAFTFAAGFKGNFSRNVRISDRPDGTPASGGESAVGTISRTHLTEGGRNLAREQLGVPVILGSNLQTPAVVKVAIENGDGPPLPITSIRLEMRERRLCFDETGPEGLALYYGDPALAAPRYGYARLYTGSSATDTARLGPEEANPLFRARPDTRTMVERHPDTLWVALLAVIGLLAMVAFRASKRLPR